MTSSDPVSHGLICGEDDDGWDEARCECGWVGGMAPDVETAADMWGDHLVFLVQEQHHDRIVALTEQRDGLRRVLAKVLEDGHTECVAKGQTYKDGRPAEPCTVICSRWEQMCAACAARTVLGVSDDQQ